MDWHAYECGLFCAIPAPMRSGDTDYLRFVLRYFAILNHGLPPSLPDSPGGGGEGALPHFEDLCTNKEKQTQETLTWCTQFAATFARFIPLPNGVTVPTLADLFLRIKSNTLGFPFTKDETIGWCLDSQVSMFNHSCDANCFISCGHDGTMSVIANSDIPPGQELCISYIDILRDEFKDTATRRAHLQDSYCFLCNCPKCEKK